MLLDERVKNRIFLGEKVFKALCEHLGILYGSEFIMNGITFQMHRTIPDNQMVTADPKLIEKFKEQEAIEKALAFVEEFQKRMASQR